MAKRPEASLWEKYGNLHTWKRGGGLAGKGVGDNNGAVLSISRSKKKENSRMGEMRLIANETHGSARRKVSSSDRKKIFKTFPSKREKGSHLGRGIVQKVNI